MMASDGYPAVALNTPSDATPKPRLVLTMARMVVKTESLISVRDHAGMSDNGIDDGGPVGGSSGLLWWRAHCVSRRLGQSGQKTFDGWRGDHSILFKIRIDCICSLLLFDKFRKMEYIMKESNPQNSAVEALGALAHDTRLSVFRLLVQAGPEGLIAGAIAQTAHVPPSTMSHHLGILERAGLVKSERESRLIHYRADYDGMRRLLSFLMQDCCQGVPEMCAELLGERDCKA